MAKKRRNIFDKINTLLFRKDTRVTDGSVIQKYESTIFQVTFP